MVGHYFCTQYAELFNEYDLFLNLSFYHGTSILMGSIQFLFIAFPDLRFSYICPNIFHVYVQKQVNDTYPDVIS